MIISFNFIITVVAVTVLTCSAYHDYNYHKQKHKYYFDDNKHRRA
jgi:hypothetical protein